MGNLSPLLGVDSMIPVPYIAFISKKYECTLNSQIGKLPIFSERQWFYLKTLNDKMCLLNVGMAPMKPVQDFDEQIQGKI